MHVAIRVDASPRIGTGHFIRTLTLAGQLTRQGSTVRFISRDLPDHLRTLALDAGHEVRMLPAGARPRVTDSLRHSHWLDTGQEDDARRTLAALTDQHWDWIVVDHYALDESWEKVVREAARRLLVIDDLADRQHSCHLLLDQNLYPQMEERYIRRIPVDSHLLVGPQFALLREDFKVAAQNRRFRDGSTRRLLVFMGGADVDNYTGRVLDGIAAARVEWQTVDIVIGAQHPCRDELVAACAVSGYACHVQTNRMAELMEAADLAIGATGSASWERCCVGLPTIGVAVAENQRPIAEALERAGAIIRVGQNSAGFVEVIAANLESSARSPDKMKALGMNAAALVDGKGTQRVVDRMGLLS